MSARYAEHLEESALLLRRLATMVRNVRHALGRGDRDEAELCLVTAKSMTERALSPARERRSDFLQLARHADVQRALHAEKTARAARRGHSDVSQDDED